MELSDSVGQKRQCNSEEWIFPWRYTASSGSKIYIIGYGSVVMAYHAPEETWEETAYYGKNHEAYNCNSARQTANHIVAIVGWDDSYSRDNFNSGSRPSRDGAWIVKTVGEIKKEVTDIPIFLMKINLFVNLLQGNL